MRRREFLTLLGGAAAAWPIAARAQHTALPVVGMLSGSSAATANYLTGFREGLRDAGYIEGQNVVIEAQWAEGEYARLPVLAAELVHRPAAIIVASGLPSVFVAKAATSTIPIVFTSAGRLLQVYPNETRHFARVFVTLVIRRDGTSSSSTDGRTEGSTSSRRWPRNWFV